MCTFIHVKYNHRYKHINTQRGSSHCIPPPLQPLFVDHFRILLPLYNQVFAIPKCYSVSQEVILIILTLAIKGG